MDTDLGDIGWTDAPQAAYEKYHSVRWPAVQVRPWPTLSQLERRAWAEAFWAARAVQIQEDNDE